MMRFSDFWFLCCYFQLIIVDSLLRYCYYWVNWAFLNRIAWELLLPVYLRKTLCSYAVEAAVAAFASSSFLRASIMFVLARNYSQLNRLLITHFFSPSLSIPFALPFYCDCTFLYWKITSRIIFIDIIRYRWGGCAVLTLAVLSRMMK